MRPHYRDDIRGSTAYPVPCAQRSSTRARDLDSSRDDVLLQGFEPGAYIGRDELRVVRVVHVAHALFGEAVLVDAALEALLLDALDRVIDRVVDPLHHGGEHIAGRLLELIGVHTDRQLARLACGLENAKAS